MVHLHYSNRLEELIRPLAGSLAAQQRRDPLARAVIVVPNRVMQGFLKLRLAEITGVAANIEFPFLHRYFARTLAAADGSVRMLEADQLDLVIFECLRAGAARGEPELRAVIDYVNAGSRRQPDRELRLFQLSVHTAHLFREYTISRAAMLSRWRSGPAPELESMREAERWQRYLYLSIFDADGRLLPRWFDTGAALYFLPAAALAAVPEKTLAAAIASPLHIFGLSYAGPEFIRVFAQLGQLCEVHIYALNPCMEFWEDVDDSYRGARELLVRRGQKGAALESGEDPFGLDTQENLALSFWGRPGREYIRLLNEVTDCDFDPHFKHPARSAQPATMLARIQQAILCREPQPAPSCADSNPAADTSIRFLGCPGARREVEIVADSIWSLIQRDAAADPQHKLRFHQIALLIPDSQLDAYLPHVETVFAQRYQIPLNLVDRPFSTARAAQAVQMLLELPLSRFSRDAVLRLAAHPAIAGDRAIDTARWEQWCEAAGVLFGADAAEWERTYVPPNHYHWDQAMVRLALGVFMGAEAGAPIPTVTGAGGSEYLPLETPQDELQSVGALIALVRRLLADALELRERRLPIGQWARLLSAVVETYIRPADPADRIVAAYCVDAIESMAPEGLQAEPVSYQVACARALARVAAAHSEQVRYAESGVAAGSFSALRSIPFRVIFAMGMGETVFPQRDRHDLLDLRTARRRAGDVSPSQRDRYLFLETLLAARDRIVLSWVSRDALTGQELQPSPVLEELRLIAGRFVGGRELEKLTTIHPVSGFDADYFPDLYGKAEGRRLDNFDRNARGAARMAALRRDFEHFCPGVATDTPLLDLLNGDTRNQIAPALRLVEFPASAGPSAVNRLEINLPLAALRRFLECPLQGAAQYALGMVDEDGSEEEDPENEPLTQSYLDITVLLRDAFWAGRGDPDAANQHFQQALRVYQLQGKAPVGPFADAAETAFLTRLRLCVTQARTMKIDNLSGWQRIRIGGAAQAIAQADVVLDPIRLKVPISRPSGFGVLEAALRAVISVAPNRDQSITCIARNNASASHFLSGYLSAIALAAAGQAHCEVFRAVVVGASKDGDNVERLSRSMKMPSRTEAIAYLELLAADIFSGENTYFLPIEAVERIVAERKDKCWPGSLRIRYLIETLRENEFAHCRSDYGPVRNAREYPAPHPDDVIKIIERRYRPILSIFGCEE